MNVSQFIGKKVVSTQGRTGYVLSVNGGNGRVECLACADDDEKEFIIDVKNIVSVGDKIIFDDRSGAIAAAKPLRLGRAGFDENGAFLGEICDYIFKGNVLLKAKIGKKNYPAERLVCGDVVIVKNVKRLAHDVIKDGEVIFKKGTPVTAQLMKKAQAMGEYVQTSLKSL